MAATIQDRAEKLYHSMDQAREGYRRMGANLPPAMAATVEEIAQHLQNIEDARQVTGYNIADEKVPFPATRERVFEFIEAKARMSRKGAGARALARKYGKDGAEKIIARKTGKHVSLRG